MTRVLVLGSTGMLGSAVLGQLKMAGLEVLEASRSKGFKFDAETLNLRDLASVTKLTAEDYVVNCVGLTKSRIDESSRESRELAVRLNVDFPNHLALFAEQVGFKVIQVATDCVFSGELGNYSELAPHDAHDVYGKTKSLGEVPSEMVMHLRCSLIGPEQGRNSLFFEWVRQQPSGAKINGYTNHMWNGLTSFVFGRIVSGVITSGNFRSGVQHLVPADSVTKNELVRHVLAALGRTDVEVSPTEASSKIDRTLSTESPEINANLFKLAGFSEIPTVAQMVSEICSELAD